MRVVVKSEAEDTIHAFENVRSWHVTLNRLANPNKMGEKISKFDDKMVWAISWGVHFDKETGLNPVDFIVRTFPDTTKGKEKAEAYMKHFQNGGLMGGPTINAIVIDRSIWQLMNTIEGERDKD